jgi:hypothetical protein
MERMPADLLSDAGAAATGSDFFRCSEFLRAENVTHSLVIGDGAAVLPVIVREVDADGRDAISPYGYPGGRVRADPPHIADVDFGGTGLISLFVRDRLGAPSLSGGTVQSVVRVHDPHRPREVKARIRTKARSNERLGYRFEWVPGGQVVEEQVRAFDRAYVESMDRLGAAERYYFGPGYFRTCLAARSAALAVVIGPGGDLAAAAIAVTSDGCLHSYLTCTAAAHLDTSPHKNVVLGLMDVAEARGLPLNLGGGVGGQDTLDHYKRRFTNSTWDFVTHRVVCDPEAYARRAAGRADGGYFPAYRAPLRSAPG